MRVLLMICFAVGLSGCTTLHSGYTKEGQPTLHWVIKEQGGCQDKLGFWKRGLRYQKCF